MRTPLRRQITLLAGILLALFFTGFPVHGGVKKELIVTGAASADGVCGTNNDGTVVALVDASSLWDCDATGAGTVTAWCGCDSAVRVPLLSPAVANVTVADDAAGTKPTGAIPITTSYVTCTCNDATGCTMTIAEPTPTSGYGRELTVASIGTGNCEISDSSGVVEVGTGLVIEPTSTARFAYLNAAWHAIDYKDNVP